MRHANQFLRLHTAHNRADAAHLVASLLEHDMIKTTLTKAKTALRLSDGMIRLAKIGSLASRRQASAFLGNAPVLSRLFGEIAKRYASRPGGFTRLVRDLPRKGDGAPMAILELVDRPPKPVTTEKKTAKEKKKQVAAAQAAS